MSKRTKLTEEQVARVYQRCPATFSLGDVRKALQDEDLVQPDPDRPRLLDHTADVLVRHLKGLGRIALEGRVWRKVEEAHPVIVCPGREIAA